MLTLSSFPKSFVQQRPLKLFKQYCEFCKLDFLVSCSASKLSNAVAPHPEERRRFVRVKLSVLGRYMLEDGREFPCQTIDINPGGVGLVAPVQGPIGSRVIVYLEHIGRIEGVIVRELENGFAMTIVAPQRK